MIPHMLIVLAAFTGQPVGLPPVGDAVSPEIATFTQVDLSSVNDRRPGLVGTAAVNGPLANVLFTYHTARLWPGELIPDLFYDGEYRPPVTVQLHGYIDIPQDMTVNIWHAGGGVNGDTSQLTIGGYDLGAVGDDTLKNVITTVALRKGTYDLHWYHTTQGTSQPHYLRIENSETGDLIDGFHLERFVPTIPDPATAKHIDVSGDPNDWGVHADRSLWYPVSLVAVTEPIWAEYWRAEFANGVVQTYTLGGDGSATVDAGAWHDTGTVEKGDGYFIVRFTEDRAERWTRVGDRMVVEHWFPASRLPTEPPVMGIAEQIRTETSE